MFELLWVGETGRLNAQVQALGCLLWPSAPSCGASNKAPDGKAGRPEERWDRRVAATQEGARRADAAVHEWGMDLPMAQPITFRPEVRYAYQGRPGNDPHHFLEFLRRLTHPLPTRAHPPTQGPRQRRDGLRGASLLLPSGPSTPTPCGAWPRRPPV